MVGILSPRPVSANVGGILGSSNLALPRSRGFFESDPGAVEGGGFGSSGFGPLSGSQKTALLFAGLRDALASFSGQPTGYLDQQGSAFQQQNAFAANDSVKKEIQAAYARGDMAAVRAAAIKNPQLAASLMKVFQQEAPKYQEVNGALYELPTAPGGIPRRVVDGVPKAPTSRTRREGSMDVFEEWDPANGRWNVLSRGAAFKPDGPAKAPDAPSGYRWGANGNLEFIPGGPADTTGKNSTATDTQRVTALFADRAREAEEILSGTGKKGTPSYKPGVQGQGSSFWQNARAQVPVFGNSLVSDDYQKYDQAKRNFVNAVLRKESGAVIGKDEFANADLQYFPQPFDTPEVIAQKTRNRQTAIEGLKRAAGNALSGPANGGFSIRKIP